MVGDSGSGRDEGERPPRASKKRARGEGHLRELLDEGRRAENAGVLERADAAFRLVAEEADSPGLRALALLRRSHVQRSRGEADEAIRLAREGRGLAGEAGDRTLEAELMNAEGAVHQGRGDFDEADALFRGMLDLTADLRVRGVALQNLGANAAMRRDFDEAERRFGESSELFARAGYRRGEAFALNNRGRVLLDRGVPETAGPILERAVAAAGEVEDLDLEALATLNLAEALLRSGQLDAAEDCTMQALGYFTTSENPWRIVECLRIHGDICARRGERSQAVRSWERALELAEERGARVEAEALRERLGDGGASRPGL